MMLASRKLRASSSGKVKLRLTCPADETSCKLSVRLKDGRRTFAFNSGTLAGGETGKVTLRLSSKGRKKLSPPREAEPEGRRDRPRRGGNRQEVEVLGDDPARGSGTPKRAAWSPGGRRAHAALGSARDVDRVETALL